MENPKRKIRSQTKNKRKSKSLKKVKRAEVKSKKTRKRKIQRIKHSRHSIVSSHFNSMFHEPSGNDVLSLNRHVWKTIERHLPQFYSLPDLQFLEEFRCANGIEQPNSTIRSST